ncbi:MAG: peptide-methionine (S)-S-oxide reductase [Limnochordia bacterium]
MRGNRPRRTTFGDAAGLLLQIIDPTLLNQQGYDVGSQYRTGVYYVDPETWPLSSR